MTTQPRRAHQLVAVLLVVAAGLFVVGAAAESGRANHHRESAGEAAGHDEASERAGSGPAGTDQEQVLGVDVESPLPVTVAVAGSLLLAGLAWWRPRRDVLVVVGLFATAYAVLDLAEVAHQLDESNRALATLAGTILALHALAAGLALWQAIGRPARGAATGMPVGRPDA